MNVYSKGRTKIMVIFGTILAVVGGLGILLGYLGCLGMFTDVPWSDDIRNFIVFMFIMLAGVLVMLSGLGIKAEHTYQDLTISNGGVETTYKHVHDVTLKDNTYIFKDDKGNKHTVLGEEVVESNRDMVDAKHTFKQLPSNVKEK